MAKYISVEQTIINPPSFGQPLLNRVRANKFGGRVRFAEFVYVVPAGTLAIADQIIFGKLPQKSKIVGHLSRLVFTAGTASSTLAIGDNIVNARHLAATAVNAAGSAVLTASEQANVGQMTTVNGSNVISVTQSLGSPQLGSLVTGTGIAANTVVTAVSNASVGSLSVTLSAAATASGSAVAVTFTGGGYETQDDSNQPSSNYGSTTDDCTIVGTVAGAVLAAGQVFTLKIAYVND
jgi:hypothetical protein